MEFIPDDLIVLALTIPLFTAAGIFLASPWPNLREGITLLGSTLLFITVISLLPDVLPWRANELGRYDLQPLPRSCPSHPPDVR